MIEKVCGQGYKVIREGGGGTSIYGSMVSVGGVPRSARGEGTSIYGSMVSVGGVPRYPLLFRCKHSFGLQNCFAAEPQHISVSVSLSNMLKTSRSRSTFLHTHTQTQSFYIFNNKSHV